MDNRRIGVDVAVCAGRGRGLRGWGWGLNYGWTGLEGVYRGVGGGAKTDPKTDRWNDTDRQTNGSALVLPFARGGAGRGGLCGVGIGGWDAYGQG